MSWDYCIPMVAVYFVDWRHPVPIRQDRLDSFDRFAGDLSYPVYINHFILIQVVGSIVVPNGLVFALVSIAFAIITVILIERPARRFKVNVPKRAAPSANTAVSPLSRVF